MKIENRNLTGASLIVAATLLFVSGCKNNSTGPGNASISSNQDAAQSIANAVGEDNGGVADQIGDIADATGSSGISANVGSAWTDGALMKSTTPSGDTVIKTFNASDTSWMVSVTRTRVGLFGRQAGFTRTYYIKFIDQNGVALTRYITTTPVDTASTIVFKTLNGSGYTITRSVSTHLLSITSDFVVSGANTPILTVNGTLTRTGTDTIKTLSGERVLNHTLVLNLQNVTGPRVPRYATATRIPRATGGTITGTYSATVAVLRGDSYTERSFTKTFTITFANGAGVIDVNGSNYTSDLTYGELSSN